MRNVGGVLVLLALLSGCGGGGGSDGGASGESAASPLDKALSSGNSAGLDEQTLLEQALEEVARLETLQQELVDGLGISGPLRYPVSRNSHFINAGFGNGAVLLRGSDSGRSFASAVEIAGQRAAGIGFEFYQPRAGAAGMDAFAGGLLTWLGGGASPQQVSLAGINASSLSEWLSAQLPEADQISCPTGLPASCLAGSQVLLLSDRPAAGDEQALQALLVEAREQGLGVVYIHTRMWNSSPLGEAMLGELGMALGSYPGNYFVEDTLDWSSAQQMLSAIQVDNPIKTALEHFYHQDFPVNFDYCDSLADGNCDNYAALKTALLDGADQLRGMLSNLDRQGRPLFAERGHTLLKLLVLLGDVWREQITYPMNKNVAPVGDFMRALYADYSVQYLRGVQPAQPDLGSFSEPMAVPPATSTQRPSVTVKGDHFTALGAYVLPGQRVRVTRTDDNDSVSTAIRINTQRTGSTRLWSEYSRPRFLASPAMSIAPGETLELTSPYGGTLQLEHRNAPVASTVSLRLDNVAQQPFLQYGPDMAQEAFSTALQNSALTWTEIRSPFAEVHSRRDRMNASINESRYAGNSQAFLDDLFDYVLRDAYTLAGFQGEGIALNQAVTQRCNTLGWDCTSADIHGLPNVLHINVDWFAHCGSGCSGNPYDQSWPLDPYGWGESHELGHNLQRGLLKIHGGRSGEVSNNLFPLHKNWRLLQERDENMSPTRLAYKGAFDVLKAGAAGADPYSVAYDAIWADDSYAANNGLRMTFFAQLPHLWREVTGTDSEGWDIVTLLYLAERQFSDLGADEWMAQRDHFGMGTFASKPDLNGNEFMLILASYLSQRDLRPLWDVWGVDYGADTSAQLDALALPAQAPVIWVGPDSNDWSQVQKVPVSTGMAWPF